MVQEPVSDGRGARSGPAQVLLKLERKDIVQVLYTDTRNVSRSVPPNYYTLQSLQNLRQGNGSAPLYHASAAAAAASGPHTVSQHSMGGPAQQQQLQNFAPNNFSTPNNFSPLIYPGGGGASQNYAHQGVNYTPTLTSRSQSPHVNQPTPPPPHSAASSAPHCVTSAPYCVTSSPHCVTSEPGDGGEQHGQVYMAPTACSSSSGEQGVVYQPDVTRGSYQPMYQQQGQMEVI